MKRALLLLVWKRADYRCEYCHFPSAYAYTPFEIDHPIAEQHGGKTTSGNLALSCFADNRHKGPNLGGIDPKTGKKTWLFNPRRHKWSRQFRWDGPMLVGRTATGRTTIAVLGINLTHRLTERRELIAEGVYPL